MSVHGGRNGTKERDVHLVIEAGLGRVVDAVGDSNVEVAIVALVGRAGERTHDLVALGDDERLAWGVEDGLSVGWGVSGGMSVKGWGASNTHFQCV
jgi:hypothetical protein